MTLIIQQLFNALAMAAIYAFVGFGITLLYGLMRVVNFTQGLLAGLGAFVCLDLTELHVPLALAVIITACGIGLGSLILWVGLFRRTAANPFNGFVISLALITALPAAYELVWPGYTYSIPTRLLGVWDVHGVFLGERQVLIIGVTAVLTAALMVALRRTQFGRGIRAVAENVTAARVLGVPVAALGAATFAIGCALAALAGALLGITFPFNAYTGNNFLLVGFAVAVVGGLGSVGGAVVAAVILSIADTFGGAYVSLPWASDFSLVAVVIVILVRPHGLFGTTAAGETLGSAEAALSISEEPHRRSHEAGGAILGDAKARWSGAETKVRRTATLVGSAALVAAPWILPTHRLLSDAVYAMVIAIATYGIWFLFRYSGVLSIAQSAFMGVGAYATGIAISRWGLTFWLQVPLAMAAAAVAATVMGTVALRTRGSYFLIVIFAMTQLLVDTMGNWQALTGGQLGLINVVAPRPLGSIGNFKALDQQYWLVLAFVAVTLMFVWGLARSAFTRRLTTVRDDELLAQSVGLNTFSHQLIAFVIAGATAGLAGVLFLYQQQAIEPDLFGIFPGAAMILVLLLGGAGVLSGPIIGSLLFTFLPDVLGLGPNTTEVVDGLLLIVVIVFLPRGIGGSLRTGLGWLFDRGWAGRVRGSLAGGA
jgi:branched-chain amino acid transport system permease protein